MSDIWLLFKICCIILAQIFSKKWIVEIINTSYAWYFSNSSLSFYCYIDKIGYHPNIYRTRVWHLHLGCIWLLTNTAIKGPSIAVSTQSFLSVCVFFQWIEHCFLCRSNFPFFYPFTYEKFECKNRYTPISTFLK